MKNLFIIFMILGLTSCVETEYVNTGTFEVERTFVKTSINNPETCGPERFEPGYIDTQTWTIREEGNGYTLSAEDNNGTEMVVAQSTNGRNFNGKANAKFLNCIWYINWNMDLQHNGGSFTGTQTDTLTMNCALGSCVDVWDIVGVLVE